MADASRFGGAPASAAEGVSAVAEPTRRRRPGRVPCCGACEAAAAGACPLLRGLRGGSGRAGYRTFCNADQLPLSVSFGLKLAVSLTT